MQITIELPDDIAKQLDKKVGGLARHTLEAIAIDGYRNEHLSHGEVGKILNLNYWEVEALLQKAKAYLHYSIDDFEQDRKTLERMDRAPQHL